MKVITDDFEIEISAKRTGKKNYTKKDTMEAIGSICGYLWELQDYYKGINVPSMERKVEKFICDFAKTLEENGYYDNFTL